jgi:hypothetical protein
MKKVLVLVLFIIILFPCYSLTEAQRWALALTEIMTVSNNDSHDTLNFDEINEKNKKIYLELLARDWGVNNREELLETINRMEIDGHAGALEKVKNIIRETKDFSIFNMINTYQLSAKQYNYFKFVLSNWSLFGNRNIVVWDYGRNISLCRWGYDCGYLTENEAWEKIMYYAKKIQAMYTSWQDYGFDYYMGRVFWASGFSEEISYLIKTDKIYRQLIGENGYWKELKWDIDLEYGTP